MKPDLPISRIQLPKAADLLADQLRLQILSGAWEEGTALPTERELVQRAGLSRASIREALRILEVEGLISTRPGRGGGSIICTPTTERLQRTVSQFIRSRRVRPETLLETRGVIEPAVARLAARNRSDADIAAIAAAQQRLAGAVRNRGEFLRANLDWHLAVTAASHNELLISFFNAISEEILRYTELDTLATEDIEQATLRAHDGIANAIRAQDLAAAERRMTRHVRAYAAIMEHEAPPPVAVPA